MYFPLRAITQIGRVVFITLFLVFMYIKYTI